MCLIGLLASGNDSFGQMCLSLNTSVSPNLCSFFHSLFTIYYFSLILSHFVTGQKVWSRLPQRTLTKRNMRHFCLKALKVSVCWHIPASDLQRDRAHQTEDNKYFRRMERIIENLPGNPFVSRISVTCLGTHKAIYHVNDLI